MINMESGTCSNCEHARQFPARLYTCECGDSFTTPGMVMGKKVRCLSGPHMATFTALVCKGCYREV